MMWPSMDGRQSDNSELKPIDDDIETGSPRRHHGSRSTFLGDSPMFSRDVDVVALRALL
jgi:hypothetical protein